MAIALAVVSCRATKDPEVDTFGLGTTSVDAVDGDGDGYAGSDDCNDNDAAQFPDAAEVCDGIDNNCDGQIDEGVLLEWFADGDGDGFGDPEQVVVSCERPDNASDNDLDCNDSTRW